MGRKSKAGHRESGLVRKLLTLIMLTGMLTLGAFVSTAMAQDEYNPEVSGTTVVRTGGTGQLPFTGSTGTSTYVLAGLGLVALGGALVLVGRRREHVLNRT